MRGGKIKKGEIKTRAERKGEGGERLREEQILRLREN